MYWKSDRFTFPKEADVAALIQGTAFPFVSKIKLEGKTFSGGV
jgi:hypothetical protein